MTHLPLILYFFSLLSFGYCLKFLPLPLFRVLSEIFFPSLSSVADNFLPLSFSFAIFFLAPLLTLPILADKHIHKVPIVTDSRQAYNRYPLLQRIVAEKQIVSQSGSSSVKVANVSRFPFILRFSVRCHCEITPLLATNIILGQFSVKSRHCQSYTLRWFSYLRIFL